MEKLLGFARPWRRKERFLFCKITELRQNDFLAFSRARAPRTINASNTYVTQTSFLLNKGSPFYILHKSVHLCKMGISFYTNILHKSYPENLPQLPRYIANLHRHSDIRSLILVSNLLSNHTGINVKARLKISHLTRMPIRIHPMRGKQPCRGSSHKFYPTISTDNSRFV